MSSETATLMSQDDQAANVEDMTTKGKSGKASKTGKSRSPSAKKGHETSKSPKGKAKGAKNQKEEPVQHGKIKRGEKT